jgi:predicted RNase H-like nuclease
MPIFLGVDLAWKSDRNHSGCVVLEGDQTGVELHGVSTGLTSLADVEGFINRSAHADTIAVIDAPLVIRNTTGQRPCETEIGRRFGAAHASAHTSNLRLYPNAGSVRLASQLERQGFQHCPEAHVRHLGGRWFFEVYPHPAHVVLFQRSQIIKYKKGTVGFRKAGLKEFRESLQRFLVRLDPPLMETVNLRSLLERPLVDMSGPSLKHYEDTLDALLCAYLAAYFWAWSYERNEMIGDLESGYIINPRRPLTN